MRGRAVGSPPSASQEQGLTEVYVTNLMELARADLANKDYEAAVRRTEDVLKVAPGNAEATAVAGQAREAQRLIAEAVAEARSAFGRGDTDGATRALGRVMDLDPRQPVIGELSDALKEHFRPQAEDARRQAEAARQLAQAARAAALPAFVQGQKLVTEAGGLQRRQDYAAAAQKFLESREAFDRSRREATDAARVAAARPSPTAPPVALVTPTPVTPTVLPTPTPAPAAQLAPPPPAPPAVVAAPPPTPTPSAAAPAPAARTASAETEVRRVIAEYGRAMEGRDVALYRSLKPDLSSEDEKRLREAFKAYKPQSVGITIDSVRVEGDRAVVQATRQDVIDGRPTKAVSQTFQLARIGSAWQILSIGR